MIRVLQISRFVYVLLQVGLLCLPAGAQNEEPADCVDDRCAFDECHADALGAPEELWSGLIPTDTLQLPPSRDNTDHNQLTFFGCSFPYFEALDAENGWLFVVTNRGFQVWDATTSGTVAVPLQVAHMCSDSVQSHPVPEFPSSNENNKFTFLDVDAPPGHDNLVATVLRNLGGFVVWDTSDKAEPWVIYQDHGSDVTQVYTTTIGLNHYSFAANEDRGLHFYNLSEAEQLNLQPCVEQAPESLNGSCSGVFLGKLGDFSGVGFVDGVSDPANGEHLVAFSGNGPAGPGLAVWDVSDPALPARTLADADGPYFGLALWKSTTDGERYLALRTRTDSRIYRDLGCLTVADSGCTLADLELVWSAPFAVGLRKFVTYSESGGFPFLYFGSSEQCASSQDPERLYEVSDPANPKEVGSETYWSSYYRTNIIPLEGSEIPRTGFNWVGPRMGKFHGEHFYRAGFGIFDVHRWAPVLAIQGPSSGLFDEQFAFEVVPSDCTPGPTYEWSASDGGTVVGMGTSVQVSWPAEAGAGPKTVTVTNSDCPGGLGEAAFNLEAPGTLFSDSFESGDLTLWSSGG